MTKRPRKPSASADDLLTGARSAEPELSPVRRVICYLGPNEVTEGYYIVEGNLLTMVNGMNRRPALISDEPVTAVVTPENQEAVAKRLTRMIRKSRRGEQVEGFGRRLNYPNIGVV